MTRRTITLRLTEEEWRLLQEEHAALRAFWDSFAELHPNQGPYLAGLEDVAGVVLVENLKRSKELRAQRAQLEQVA